jgi:hypothetical protein
MKRLISALLILILYISASYARSDLNCSLVDWDVYYIQFGISGYPHYNAALDRYDFFDLDDNYRGSLCYNALLEKWEYLGL